MKRSSVRRLQSAPLVRPMLVFLPIVGLATVAWSHDPSLPAREVRMQARLDGSRVVRPADQAPPTHGSGSKASAEALLSFDTATGNFAFDIYVRGIAPELLEDSLGSNGTAIHIRSGDADSNGEILIDVHYFARELSIQSNGLTIHEDGFSLHADADFNSRQGRHEPSVTPDLIIDLLRSEEAYVSVHTTGSPLFREGEIRGNLRLVPEVFRASTALDGAQVVRPAEFQPPQTDTGSDATGQAEIVYYTRPGYFRAQLSVDGMDAQALDPGFGANGSAIVIHRGDTRENGDALLDLHHFARRHEPRSDGVVPRPDGFDLQAEGYLTPSQGALDTGLDSFDMVEALLDGEVYIDVRTASEPLFRHGEIRGGFVRMPREIRLLALLDGDQVVRPRAFRPPTHGSGSLATGVAELIVDLDTAEYRFELDVDGIDPADLDSSHGGNETAVHVDWGTPSTTGPILLDVHHFATAQTGSLEPTDDGFQLRARGLVRLTQGQHFVRFPWDSTSKFLSTDQTYVSVHTTGSELFRSGEIRGQLHLVPDVLRLDASLDGAQVVRPEEHRPPLLGSGSEASGEVTILVETRTGDFSATVDVSAIEPVALDATHGPNASAIRIHAGVRDETGPAILDLQHFARTSGPADGSDGIVATESGFRLHATGRLARVQGDLDTGLGLAALVRRLQSSETYVSVHSTTSDLFRSGEIRGALTVTPEILELTSFLDESGVVRPPTFSPPRFGTGSTALGEATMRVDVSTGGFAFDLRVSGIEPSRLFNSQGANLTAIHIEKGAPGVSGPILLDVHVYARTTAPETNGVTADDDGFLLHAEGTIAQVQGRLDSSFSSKEIIDSLRDQNTHVAIHTIDNVVYRSGEIRGDLRLAGSDTDVERFIRGDCDGDGRFAGAVTDAVFLLNFNFSGGPEPYCAAACDANGDGRFAGGVTDAVYMLNFNFLGGTPPPEPYPACGPPRDLLDRRLGCISPPALCD